MLSKCILMPWLLLLGFAVGALGHAYVLEPPSRNFLKHRSGEENCPHCLQSGGPPAVQARGNGVWPTINDYGSHGLCGDPKQLSPEPASIADMTYMEASPPQRTYVAGDVVEFRIHVSTHHYGHFEFRICDRLLDGSLSSAAEGQQCLNAHLLHRAPRLESCGGSIERDCQPINPAHPERWYLPPPLASTQVAGAAFSDMEASAAAAEVNHGELYVMRYVIPETLACEHCTLQWYYATGNSCAFDSDYFTWDPGFQFFYAYPFKSSWARCSNTCCGPEGNGVFGEEFWNCADIRIIGASTSEPTTTMAQTGSSTPEPTTTSTAALTSTATLVPEPSCAPFSQWPDVDNGVTCGSCTALVRTAPYGGRCDVYCQSFRQVCVAAAEEVNENCEVKFTGACQEEIQGTSDMLCTCKDSSASTTQTSPAPTPGPSVGIQSGDTIFLKTHSGQGNMLHIDGTSVRAMWQERGAWQALTIEKNGGGAVQSGDTVFLRGHTGAQIDVQGLAVQARWAEKGLWQSFTVERPNGDGPVSPGDVVCFKAHTGKHIDVEDDTARARWTDCGFWQGMRIERQGEDVVINSGDDVYLMAHTGKLIDVEGDSVSARWAERGLWQRLRIEKQAGGTIHSGDAIFLIAHTAKMLDVQSSLVQARWTDTGAWQTFVIESASGGPIQAGESIFLRAHTGNLVDAEGESVSARWPEQGLWQSLTIEKHSRRLLQQAPQASLNTIEGEEAWFGLALGIVAGLVAAASAVAILAKLGLHKQDCRQLCPKLSKRTGPTSGLHYFDSKVHPCMDPEDGSESE